MESQLENEEVALLVQSCMDKIIKEDEKLGEVRDHDCEKTTMAETIQKYADGLKKLDFAEKGPDAEELKSLLKAVWDTWGEVEAAMKK